jgi:beta-galactosidase
VCAIHSAPCRSLHVPYSVPSENGGRSNTQWIEFSPHEESAHSLPKIRIRSNPLCTFSAQNYSTEDLTRSLHSSDLSAASRDHLCVNLDPYMMAVGSDDCWSVALSDKLILTPKVYSFKFVITAVTDRPGKAGESL